MLSRNASPYQAKYGWNLRPVIFSGILIVICVVVLVEPGALWIRILAGVFGPVGLFTASAGLTRKTAFRIDSSGVTYASTRSSQDQPRSAPGLILKSS